MNTPPTAANGDVWQNRCVLAPLNIHKQGVNVDPVQIVNKPPQCSQGFNLLVQLKKIIRRTRI